MNQTGRCVGCGAEIPPGVSSDGLCPVCLLKLGLAGDRTPGDEDQTATASRYARAGAGWMIPDGQPFGSYRVNRPLGKGGMGEVYEAEDESGRRVALKVLTHGLDDVNDRARFLREGRLAASISHPHTVYVYGTDEIEGVPIIAMELATGGTLKDRVKGDGPLAPAEAVDTILQVISGLDAAAAAGVLHRDVKPSNCFVDSEGRIKVGDFGLSMSTLARAERDLTELTMTGTFLGTPAFASPEQLRADDLDVRSDIYSVGATLYYLLTGRAPFEETNVLKLATMIAQDPAPPLAELKPDVPSGVAAVVMRCLAKRPDDRFQTYAALAKELEPFGSTASKPAPVGLRVAAGAIDWFVVGLLLTPVFVFLEVGALDSRSTAFALRIASIVVTAAYFGVLESRWGASAGKAACGLQVVGSDRLKPGLGTALFRGLVFAVAVQLVEFLVSEGPASAHPGMYAQAFVAGRHMATGMVVHFPFADGDWKAADFWFMGIVLLFSTARRRNGFAGIHGLWSHTRVVMKPGVEARPITRTERSTVEPRASVERLGPFQVLDHLNDDLVLAYDGRLRRKVWIRRLSPGTPPLSVGRRDLSRPGRLHWLTGRRTANECWDAYEAVEGTPLVALLSEPQPWSQVRHWLRDLATELGDGLKGGTIPILELDRVWITADSRAKLLDWPAPGVEVEGATEASVIRPTPVEEGCVRHFLSSVAASALLGRVIRPEPGAAAPALPLPLSARRFLQQLGEPTSQTLEQLGTVLDALAAAPAHVSRRRRWIHLGICGVVPLLAWTYIAPAGVAARRWADQHPDMMELRVAVYRLELLQRRVSAGTPPQPEELEGIGFVEGDVEQIVRALEVHIARRFLELGTDPAEWAEPFISPSWPSVAEAALAAHPSPSRLELDEAAKVVGPFLTAELAELGEPVAASTLMADLLEVFALTLVILLLPAAIMGLLSAASFHGGLLLRLLGVGIVTASGEEASRVRGIARATISWLPILPAGLITIVWIVEDFLGRNVPEPSGWWLVVVVPWLAGVAWSAYLLFWLGSCSYS